MYIIDLNYKVSVSQIEEHITEHRRFLDKYYEQQVFISSGPKEPRTGGIILAAVERKEQLIDIIQKDPFYIHNLAEYTITEFRANKGIFAPVPLEDSKVPGLLSSR
jgi:uncharacterized protein YciI